MRIARSLILAPFVTCGILAGCYVDLYIDTNGGTTGTGGSGGATASSSVGTGGGACAACVPWAKQFGGANSQVARSVVADGTGNVLVTGFYYDGSPNFGGAPLAAAGAGSNIFLAKLNGNASGAYRWSNSFAAAQPQAGRDSSGEGVAVDAGGNVFVTGYVHGAVDFGGATLTSAGQDVFVAKLDPDGGYLWGKLFGYPLGQSAGHSIAVDAAGDVIITGEVWGAINFGGTTFPDEGVRVFVAKLHGNDGSHVWSNVFGSVQCASVGYGVAVDRVGDVFVTGAAGGPINFGGGTLTSAGDYDIFLAKLNGNDGSHAWSKLFGDFHVQVGNSVAVDGLGNAWITGYVNGSVNFGTPMPLTSVGEGIFVANLSGDDGSYRWANAFGVTTSQRQGESIAVDVMGNVLVTGWVSGVVDFGGGPLMGTGIIGNIFVAKFTQSGGYQSAKLCGDGGGFGITSDSAGNAIVTGSFTGTADFGTGPLVSADNDIFVARFSP